MEKLQQFWRKLPANRKRQLVIGAAFAFMIIVLWQFLFGGEVIEREQRSISSVRLTGANTEQFGMDAMESRLRSMENRYEEMEKELEEARNDDSLRVEMLSMRETYEERINELRAEVKEQEKRRQNEIDLVQSVHILEEDTERARPISEQERQPVPEQAQQTPTEEELWRDSGRFQRAESRTSSDDDERQETPQASIQIINSGDDDDSDGDGEHEREKQYIPAGSIISAELVSGLDAPTSRQARSEPHPALARIKDDTILPNRYRADLRECFVLLGGFGDMSSERAYLRSETLSCIDNDGNVMEMNLESFAVGEDGSAGMRGRLVSRDGRMIAQSVKAGALSSMADVFGASPVPTIQTSASDTTPFQQSLSRDAAQASALQGAGSAMERIADYYLEMADQIFPILEINAGRRVDLIVNRGAVIDFTQ